MVLRVLVGYYYKNSLAQGTCSCLGQWLFALRVGTSSLFVFWGRAYSQTSCMVRLICTVVLIDAPTCLMQIRGLYKVSKKKGLFKTFLNDSLLGVVRS